MNQPGYRHVIVGLGITGQSVARYLTRIGDEFAVVDSRANPPALEAFRAEFPDVPCHLGDLDCDWIGQAEQLIVSPGVSVRTPEIARAAEHAEIVGDIELFARMADAPVIAITGSNGKSTVTSLLGAMAERSGVRAAVGGNIGTPALDLLEADDQQAYILELSSFQLETTYSLQPLASVVLNISPDHMDRYANLAAYAEAKAVVYQQAGIRIVNRDDAIARELAGSQEVVSFGLGEPVSILDYGLRKNNGRVWLVQGDEQLMPESDLRIPGRHNTVNILAALALAEALGLNRQACLDAARDFSGLPHRCQWVAETSGRTWLNDSKGTNIGATVAALKGIPKPVILIAGGQGKDQDFSELAEGLAGVTSIILFGQDADKIAEAIEGKTDIHRVDTLEHSVALASQLSAAGDTILFSPACASFDQFSNYEERGNAFVQAVGGLGQ
jgi:UDP-N-acetylmuramoylalanine--D-glutamate ligase